MAQGRCVHDVMPFIENRLSKKLTPNKVCTSIEFVLFVIVSLFTTYVMVAEAGSDRPKMKFENIDPTVIF